MKIRTSCKNSTAVASVRIGKSSVVNFIISFGVLCCVRGRERLEMLSLYTIYTKQHEKILIYSDWGGGGKQGKLFVLNPILLPNGSFTDNCS